MTNSDSNLVNFLFEVSKLKVTPRAGWFNAGIENPESVAAHSCSAAFVAFVLAKLEGADPFKCAAICAMHELPEVRIGDIDAIARKYIDKSSEKKVMEDQLSLLTPEMRKDMEAILNYGDDSSKEQIVAKDADYLEMLIQAIRYKDAGHKNVQHWIDETPNRLKTESAKRLAKEIINSNSYEWAKNLKVLKR